MDEEACVNVDMDISCDDNQDGTSYNSAEVESEPRSFPSTSQLSFHLLLSARRLNFFLLSVIFTRQ